MGEWGEGGKKKSKRFLEQWGWELWGELVPRGLGKPFLSPSRRACVAYKKK